MIAGNSPRSAQSLEQGLELRHEKDDQHVDHDRAEYKQDHRVGQRADHSTFKLILLLGELGKPVECLFKKSAFAAGTDNARGQLAEGCGWRAIASDSVAPSSTRE